MNCGKRRQLALFLFAHHDDEFFVAATMRRFLTSGTNVAALWLTSGGLQGRRREAESRRAAALVGLANDDLYFLRLADGAVLLKLDETVRRLERLLAHLDPDLLFVPAFEGGHPDHDGAQLAAVLARQGSERQPQLYEFPLYRRGGVLPLRVASFLPAATAVERRSLDREERLLKKRIARLYRSQRLLLQPLLALGGGAGRLHRRGEPYRLVPPERDYSRPPHGGRPLYEYYTRRRFREFAALAREGRCFLCFQSGLPAVHSPQKKASGCSLPWS